MSQKFSEYLSRKRKSEKEDLSSPKQAVQNGSNGSSMTHTPLDWNDLDTVLRRYTSNGDLPPMLSPKIPAQYETINTMTTNEPIIPQLLSPTLPSKYEELQKPPTKDNRPVESKQQRSFEKVEHFGVHSYRYVKSPTKNELLLTLYVPRFYKKNKHLVSHKESSPAMQQEEPLVGLGIKQNRKRSLGSDGDAGDDKQVAKAKPLSHQEHLRRRKDELLGIAREKKHAGDSLRNKDVKLAVVYFIDCIIVYLVAFSYEDQGRRLAKKLYNDNPWMSLIAFIDSVLDLCRENELDDITGLCLQIRMVVYEHVCKIVGEFVQLDQARKRKKSYEKAEDVEMIQTIDERINVNVKNLLRYRELSKRGLMQSEKYLSVFKLQENYPAIVSYFHKRKPRSPTCSGDLVSSNFQENMDPLRDSIQLPITHGVNIREITAYGLRLVKQWCSKEGLAYSAWSFQ